MAFSFFYSLLPSPFVLRVLIFILLIFITFGSNSKTASRLKRQKLIEENLSGLAEIVSSQ